MEIKPTLGFDLNGSSVVAGAFIAIALLGHISPWWLVAAPLLFIRTPWDRVWKWEWRAK